MAFAGCEALNSVIIPKTVTKIGSKAFANCKSIDSIIIPNTVTDIGAEAFGGCEKLQQFTLPTKFTIFKDDVKKKSVDLIALTNNPFKTTKVGDYVKFVGDYVKFGSFPQTADGQEQPIEWQILSIEGKKMFVISRYGLDAKRFDDSSHYWESSEIRQWANGDFYNKAFNEAEKKYINYSKLSDVGTSDNVFLLSKEEAEKYFANNDSRKCKATAYAVKNGAYVYDNGFSWWWLRSHYDAHTVFNVRGENGMLSNTGSGGFGIARPALWINL